MPILVSMSINFQGTTGDGVRLLRDYLKITQTELANRMKRRGVEINPSYISRIEAGVMEPVARVTPLAPLLRALEDEFGPQADARDLAYRSDDTRAVAWLYPALTSLIRRRSVGHCLLGFRRDLCLEAAVSGHHPRCRPGGLLRRPIRP